MDAQSVNSNQEEVNPAVELLNQTCLDLVAQIEHLKGENARLKKKARAQKGSGPPSG